jgi:cobyrinic acid a,c-diamide synthase
MQQDKLNSITLVLGGVRSGKSSYAQRLAEQGARVTFVATAEGRDDEEMRRKIERHRAERPAHWMTVEEPLDLAAVIARAECGTTILIDCLTLFAANLLEAYAEDEAARERRIDEVCAALQATACQVILVSNEVGSGVVPAYALGRRFRDLVGEINQRIAAIAGRVILLVAGLPVALKGEVPTASVAAAAGMPGFLIAGAASGVGKTTATLAITASLRRRGLAVQLYKGGPDFLDTGHHTRISGRVSRNLDTWMLSPEANRDVFERASAGADVAIVEGMMGLFDGKDGLSEVGSSAEIAKLLKLPVVLVVDASKSARSVGAVVLGFERFDPTLSLAGVILNGVAGERHFEMLRVAIESACKTPVLGWLARNAAIAIPERHLGLQTAEEVSARGGAEETIDRLAAQAEEHLDMARLLMLRSGVQAQSESTVEKVLAEPLRIGVARDEAFTFYYEDNLDLLREEGATIVPFSLLHDEALPPNLDALYLGGGYPELYAARLGGNDSMVAEIREFAAGGRPIYAECGGMMYLAQSLTTLDGASHSMAGVMPLEIEMTTKLVNFGYVTVELTEDCPLGMRGTTLRGHSFHYSRIVNKGAMDTAYRVTYSLAQREEAEGFRIGNVLASYVHLHFRTSPMVAASFVRAAAACRGERTVPQ